MKIKKFLPVIGIAIFVYLLVKLDLKEILNEISRANLFFIAISVALVFVFLTTQTLKWYVIAKIQEIEVPFKDAFKINLISSFYGLITPSRLGTVMRAEYLKKYTKNIGKGLSNFTLDKVLDLISIFFIAIIFSFVFREKLDFIPVEFFIIIFLGLIVLTFIFINKERAKFLLRFVYNKFIPRKKREFFKATFESFYENIPKKRYFILFFMLNLLNWIVLETITYFIGLSLGINLPLIFYLAILPIVTLVSMIPITIGGLGTREATMITLFGIFGASAEKVFSMSLISLLIVSLIPSLIAVCLLLKNDKFK